MTQPNSDAMTAERAVEVLATALALLSIAAEIDRLNRAALPRDGEKENTDEAR
jgi:hypothetical protein